jgi:hypothetical protein
MQMSTMQRRAAAFALSLLALAALAGCAGRELQRSEGFVRPAASASIRFYTPPSLSVRITRSGTRYAPPVIGAADRAHAQTDLREMFRQIEQQLQARLDENLRQKGLPRGDDLVIALDVEQAYDTGYGPGATINVRALFKDTPPGSPVWSFKFQALSSLADDPQKTAAKFADKVMHEVEAGGMLRVPAKR